MNSKWELLPPFNSLGLSCLMWAPPSSYSKSLQAIRMAQSEFTSEWPPHSTSIQIKSNFLLSSWVENVEFSSLAKIVQNCVATPCYKCIWEGTWQIPLGIWIATSTEILNSLPPSALDSSSIVLLFHLQLWYHMKIWMPRYLLQLIMFLLFVNY